MRVWARAACAALLLCTVVAGSQAYVDVELTATLVEQVRIRVGRAIEQQSGSLPVGAMRLVLPPTDRMGCHNYTLPPRAAGALPYAVVALRGSCSFREKALKASAAGAAVLIVSNTVRALYAAQAGSMALVDPCVADCGQGLRRMTNVTADAAYAGIPLPVPSCASQLGVVTAVQPEAAEPYHVCCVLDSPLGMSGMSGPVVPVFSTGIRDGRRLVELVEGGTEAQPATCTFSGVKPSVDGASVVILCVAVATLVVGAYCATRIDVRMAGRRASSRIAGQGGSSDETSDALQPVHMSVGNALCFLVMACVMLVGLFFLLKAGAAVVIMFIIVLFALGGSQAISAISLVPLLRSLFPQLRRTACTVRYLGPFSKANLIGGAAGYVVGICWFAWRRSSGAWVLQNVMAVHLCIMFLLTIRLPSLRVATVLLCLFFAYDVFMVFLSPYIFGSSVMVDVATAGGGSQEVTPGGQCVRREGDRFPMVLTVPRMSGERDGFALLGLGDIVLPGLLVVFALRADLLLRRAREPWYFIGAMSAYVAGLTLAFLANTLQWTINNVQGQPALLYLVPCVLGTTTLMAWRRGDLAQLWTGPPQFGHDQQPQEHVHVQLTDEETGSLHPDGDSDRAEAEGGSGASAR